jgi:hypothetical protein
MGGEPQQTITLGGRYGNGQSPRKKDPVKSGSVIFIVIEKRVFILGVRPAT